MEEEPRFGVGQTLHFNPTWVSLSLQQTLIKHLLYTVLSSGDATVCEIDTFMPSTGTCFSITTRPGCSLLHLRHGR